MNHAPKRRGFRFSLSTVLILTGILALAMACRPYVVTETLTVWTHWGKSIRLPQGYHTLSGEFKLFGDDLGFWWSLERQTLNRGLARPTLAAFVMWKAFAFALRETAPQKGRPPATRS